MMIQSTAANHTSSKVYSTAAAAKCQNIGNKDLCYLPRKTECTTRRMNWSSSCCQTTAQCWSPTQPAHNGTVLNTDSAYTTAQCWSPTQPAHNDTVLNTDSLHTMAQCWIQTACTQRHSAEYRLSLHNSTVLITDPTCTQRHSAGYRQPAYNVTVPITNLMPMTYVPETGTSFW